MTDTVRAAVVCSCEDTMTLDPRAIAAGLGVERVETARHLCRAEIGRFEGLAASGRPLTIACTQESPRVEASLEERGLAGLAAYVNVREAGGWSEEGAKAGPKMAALLAGAAEPKPDLRVHTLESQGVLLVLGRDGAAIEAGRALAETMDVTVLLLPGADVMPPPANEFPIRQGKVAGASGHLGAFELTVDAFAEPLASSRARLVFGPARSGLPSTPDVILDLSGNAPLFPAHDLRPGYVRADSGDRAAVERAIRAAGALVGTFDKPVYVTTRDSLCAHSRSRKTGCTRCLDLCPTGAISPAGDHVVVDPAVCAGCGQCAAACPTGAIEYVIPTADAGMRRLRAMATAFARAGGTAPVFLVHDGEHGEPLIDACARYSTGLPARVVPFRVNEITQIGLEWIAAAFAYGAGGVIFLARAKAKHPLDGLERTIATANMALAGLGYGAGAVHVLATDDPDTLAAATRVPPGATPAPKPSTFAVTGTKRNVLGLAMRELHRAAPAPVDTIALPAGSVFGRVEVKTDGCTLCHACVAACPTGALKDDPTKPLLSFREDACVQCGLCAATCPEKVITLDPRIHFPAFNAPAKVVKEEEPFACIACGKPFGTKSTIERVVAKLEGKHWMFAGAGQRRIDVVRMCDTCRVEAVTNEGFDPHSPLARPVPKTSEDYIREREQYLADRARLERGEDV